MPLKFFLAFGIAILLSSVTSPAHSKTLRLKSGETVTGRVLGATETYIQLEVRGESRTYYFDEIDGGLTGKLLSAGERKAAEANNGANNPDLRSARLAARLFDSFSPAVASIRMEKKGTGGTFACMGFVVDPDGLVATALHCTSWFDDIQVRLQDGRVFPAAEVAAFDPDKDLCVLKIDAKNLPALPLGRAQGLRLDRRLYTILVSTGQAYQISEGRLLAQTVAYGRRAFRCNLPIFPGHSGGPVLDGEGRAIGMHSWIELNSSNYRYFMPLDGLADKLASSKPMSLEEFQEAAKVQGLLDEGSAYLQQKSTDTALALFREAVELNPQSFKAHEHLADALLTAGKIDDAIETYRKAGALNPQEARANLGLAGAYLVKRKYTFALQFAQKAARQEPEHPWALQLLGECYLANRQYVKASEILKKSAELAPDNCAIYPTLSAAYLAQRRVMESKKYLDEAKRRGCEISEGASQILESSIQKAWWLGSR